MEPLARVGMGNKKLNDTMRASNTTARKWKGEGMVKEGIVKLRNGTVGASKTTMSQWRWWKGFRDRRSSMA